MTIDIYKSLLLEESCDVQWFWKDDITELGTHVCAFLNGGGGYIVCGVKGGAEVVGVSKNILEPEFQKNLSLDISPKSLISVEFHELQNKHVVVIEVPAGKDIPYAYKNDIFIRDKKETIKADINTIRDMVFRRQNEPERWERRFTNAELDEDLSFDELKATISASVKLARINFRDSESPIKVLEDLSVARYGKLTNAADVLFAKTPSVRYPQVRLRAVSYTDDKVGQEYSDFKTFEGPLMKVLEDAYSFIVRNTPTKAIFSPGELKRKDQPLYPTDAIREGLVNALIHRDYSDSSGGVAVHIYPTRLEIWNSGELPDGVTPQSLLTGHISVLRNPDMAHVLYLRGLMEKLGRGSIKIQIACKELDLPSPQWKSVKNQGVTLTFYAPAQAATLAATQAATLAATQAPAAAVHLTDEIERMLKMMSKADKELSRAEIQKLLKKKDIQNVRDTYIKPAIELGYIEPTIPDKPSSPSQKYRVTQKGRKLVE